MAAYYNPGNTIRSISASQEIANNAFGFMGKSPLELTYMRRVIIREQKMYMILRKLNEDLPITFLKTHIVIMSLWILIVSSIQIVLIVFKSPLYYICAGFWCGAYFSLCIILTVLLSKIKFKRLVLILDSGRLYIESSRF